MEPKPFEPETSTASPSTDDPHIMPGEASFPAAHTIGAFQQKSAAAGGAPLGKNASEENERSLVRHLRSRYDPAGIKLLRKHRQKGKL